MTDKRTTVDEYIAAFPDDARKVLAEVRAAIHRAGPGLDEAISYGMAVFKHEGKHLIYMGGWKSHVGVYPVPRLGEPLEARVEEYRAAKDTLRFRYDRPVPHDLVVEVVKELLGRRLGERPPPGT